MATRNGRQARGQGNRFSSSLSDRAYNIQRSTAVSFYWSRILSLIIELDQE